MVVSKIMTFYPNGWLFNFFDIDFLNYMVTVLILSVTFLVFMFIINRYFKKQFELYVSKHILKRVSYSDKVISTVRKLFRILAIVIMITMLLALFEQSKISAMLTQWLFTIAWILKLVEQARRNWVWRKRKKAFNKLEKSSQQIDAINKLYRVLMIETIVVDIFIIPISLCSIDFTGMFPYVLSNPVF